MSLTNELIQQKLTDKFGDQLTDWVVPYGMLTFTAPKELNLKILQFLYDEPELKFQFLTDLQAVHYPDSKGAELAVVYHLHNLTDNVRLRFKIFTDISNPDVYSATSSVCQKKLFSLFFSNSSFIQNELITHPVRRQLNLNYSWLLPHRSTFHPSPILQMPGNI